MPFDWNFAAAVTEVGDLFTRLNNAFLSMTETRTEVKGKELVAGDNPIQHGQRSIPRQVDCVIVGDSASTAIVTRGAMDRRVVHLHATTPCVVDLVIYGSPS